MASLFSFSPTTALLDLEHLTQTTLTRLSNVALDLGLTRFPAHQYTFLTALFFFLAVHQAFAPVVSGWMSSSFRKLDRRGKNNWSIHVVSQVHVLVVVPMALRILNSPSQGQDRAFGWDEGAGSLQAIASAYFVWDTFDAIINFTDVGFIVHGFACSLIYLLSFRPFLSYYASRCLLWESSTFFLNIHWFLDKTNRTGSTFQLVNGILLLATFFFVRLIGGAYVSYQFFFTLYDAWDEIPLAYALIYGTGNIVLQGLNVFWFMKMITALRKRFSGGDGKRNGKLDAKEE
ncbi:TLC domain-containing protein [Rhodocollybia butyracea]|uniref:TLC domain-containing protein n=1 Tax=Rhodocollybia butyracea TaxID=206335 RepID=A0A9P5U1S6_9AGAR|nr:TLC domain-containing protein [Rhodocollybia butyracea]